MRKNESFHKQTIHEMSDFNKPFKITIPSADFDALRKDHKFRKILRLARFVNQLGFCLGGVLETDEKKISYSRQHANSLLFMSAVLFEGLLAYERLESDFGNIKCYKLGHRSIFKSPDYSLLRDNLELTRNKLTFHIDTDIYKETLKWVEFEEYLFIKGSDGKVDNIHFALADDVALNYLAGDHDSDEKQLEHLQNYINKLTVFVTRFLRASNDLLHWYADKKNWPVTTIEESN